MKPLLLLVLLVGCTDTVEPVPDGGAVQYLDDGAYQVSWLETEPGEWLDCDGFELRGDGMAWLGGSCREPEVKGEPDGDCRVYLGAGYSWRVCPGEGRLVGEREEEGAVVAEFTAERRW